VSEQQQYRLVITGEAEVTKAPQPEQPDAEPAQDHTTEGN
jgi:hypothetical protein